jgi:hypothetical protein
VANAGQTNSSALVRYSIASNEMTGVHVYTDAITIQNQDARFADMLRVQYGVRSCHWSITSIGG